MTPASTQYPRANDASSPEQGVVCEPRLASTNEHHHDHMQGHGHDPVHSHGHGHDHSDRQVSARVWLSPVLASVWARFAIALALSGLLWLAVVWALLKDV